MNGEPAADPATAALDRARALGKLGRHDLAVTFALDAIASAPDDGEAHVLLAHSYRLLERMREAGAAARAAIALAPASPTAHVASGMVHLENGETWLAIAAFHEAVRLDPSYADAYRLIAYAQMKQRRFFEALGSARQALAIDPNSLLALEIEAHVLRRLGRTREAESATARLLNLAPESAEGLRELGHLHLRRGRHGEARAAFAEALRLDPASSAARGDYAESALPFGILRFAPTFVRMVAALGGLGALVAAIGGFGPASLDLAVVWTCVVLAFLDATVQDLIRRRYAFGRFGGGATRVPVVLACAAIAEVTGIAAETTPLHPLALVAVAALVFAHALRGRTRAMLSALQRRIYGLYLLLLVPYAIEQTIATAVSGGVAIAVFRLAATYLACIAIAAVARPRRPALTARRR